MIKLVVPVPRKCAVAVSGGADSMAALDFFSRSRDVVALHFNHGSAHADDAEAHVRAFCEARGIPLKVGRVQGEMPAGVSHEAWWRDQRYAFFDSCTDRSIVMGHHLGDAVEGWIFSSMQGTGYLIPLKRDQYLRPFLATKKEVLVSWCERKDVPYVTDPSNLETRYRRNYIRNVMMPHVLEINPGIYKTIRKKVLAESKSL